MIHPQKRAFSEEARTWLGSQRAGGLRNLPVMDHMAAWQSTGRRSKAEAGWACIRWPKAYGGRDASAIEQVILNQEEAKVNSAGYRHVRHWSGYGGADAHELMPRKTTRSASSRDLASGEEDLVSALQRAGRRFGPGAPCAPRQKSDGDDWVINGQKIWTSGAHYSDWGILVVRTDPTVPKHKGPDLLLRGHEEPGH